MDFDPSTHVSTYETEDSKDTRILVNIYNTKHSKTIKHINIKILIIRNAVGNIFMHVYKLKYINPSTQLNIFSLFI